MLSQAPVARPKEAGDMVRHEAEDLELPRGQRLREVVCNRRFGCHPDSPPLGVIRKVDDVPEVRLRVNVDIARRRRVASVALA